MERSSLESVTRASGLRPGDPGEVKVTKVNQLVRNWSTSPDIALPRIASLLSVPVVESHPPVATSPERQKEDTFEALISLFVGKFLSHPYEQIAGDASHNRSRASTELLTRIP